MTEKFPSPSCYPFCAFRTKFLTSGKLAGNVQSSAEGHTHFLQQCTASGYTNIKSCQHNWWHSNFIRVYCTYMSNEILYLSEWQDNSNLRWLPKNKTPAKKQYFTVNFIHLVHTAWQILSTFTTNQCHSQHSLCLHCHSTTHQYQSHPMHWIYSTP
jgi:hypothetical protein